MAKAAAAVAPQPVSAQVVGNAFVQQYYHILHHSPALVHRFYQDVSKLGRPEDDGSLSVTTTMIAINEKILSLNYGDFRAEIKSVDAQESFNGGVQVLVTGYLTGIDNMICNFSQCFFLVPQDRGYFVLNDIFRYVESSNQPDEKQVLVDDVVDPVTQEQSPVPPAVQENHASDESNHADEVTEGEVFNPPEKGDVPTVEEEVKVPEVVDAVQDDSQPVVESDSKVEEVQKKSYASIEKMVPFSSPAPAPKKSPQKSQEQQSVPPPASETDGQIPSSGASDNGNFQEGEAGYSMYVKDLPMTATVSMLENAFKKFGQIRSGGIQVRSIRQQGFCFGFVEFEVPIAVEKALELEDECGLDLGFGKEPEILAIENAVKVLLQGLGEDVNREGIRKTPLRVAKALREGTKGYRMKAQDIVHDALFPEAGLENGVGHAGGMGGLVIVRDLDFFSYCEACLLPFQVKCHVGYIPCGQVVVGLSKLSRVVDTFAKRLQDPHRLADEVCKSLHDGIKPAGVAVVLQCFHIHSPKIGYTFLDVNDHGWTKTLITSGSGLFEDKKADDWSDFLSLLKFKTKNLANDAGLNGSLDKCWCPLKSSSKTNPVDPTMMTAVVSIIRSLGEDPLREELIGTPAGFVTWLMNFKKCNLEMKLNGGLVLNGTVSHGEEHICSELNLSFLSQCEHHLLPFYGVVHIGYLSCKGVNSIGRSVLHSIVHFYGFKLQVQERLTKQVAETVSSLLGKDVMVVVEAEHTCMISRGIEKFGSNTATFAVLGQFSSNPALRTNFLQSIPSFCKREG